MPGQPKPAMRARPGGGMNQGLGQFGEHLDESALAQAGAQKALSQAAADPAGAMSAAQGQKIKQQMQDGGVGQPDRPPRSVGSITDELIKRPAQDIWAEIKSFFSLNTWLGIKANTIDPIKKQKQMATHRRWQQLNQEQQALAKQKYQEELKKKELEEEEKQRRKQAEEEQKQQQVVMPSSPKKGPVGPASGQSKKKQTTQLMQQQRQMLSQGGGSN